MGVTRKQALRSLWKGKCTIYVRVRDPVADPNTGRTVYKEVAILEDELCRLSFSSINDTSYDSGAQRVTQSTKLFLDRLINVPPGSKIVVTQNGITQEYEKSGMVAVYKYHQEIPLSAWTKWA